MPRVFDVMTLQVPKSPRGRGKRIYIECDNCDGTGISNSVGKIGAICLACRGTARQVIYVYYKPFKRIKRTTGIERVISRHNDWLALCDRSLRISNHNSVTYREFLRGKRPTLKPAPRRKCTA